MINASFETNCITEHSFFTFRPSQLMLSSACSATVDNMRRRRCRVSLLQGGRRKIRSWRACSWSAFASAAGKKGTLMSVTHLKLPQKTRQLLLVCRWYTCAPHTRCWWRLCRALLLAAGQACLWGTLSVMQPHHGHCAPRPNEPPIPGQIPCEAGRDFLILQILINDGLY